MGWNCWCAKCLETWLPTYTYKQCVWEALHYAQSLQWLHVRESPTDVFFYDCFLSLAAQKLCLCGQPSRRWRLWCFCSISGKDWPTYRWKNYHPTRSPECGRHTFTCLHLFSSTQMGACLQGPYCHHLRSPFCHGSHWKPLFVQATI